VKSVQCLIESREEEELDASHDPSMNKSVNDRNWNWKDKNFKYSIIRSTKPKSAFVGIYCMDALSMALHIVYYTESFKEAILRAVNLGGDADTVAAIVGMIAGAVYGYQGELKEWYLKYVMKWDEQRVPIRAYKLFKLSTQKQDSEDD